MFVKNIQDCPEFTANDGCQIREWLHPNNDSVDLPYSIAKAVVAAGQRSYKHTLEQTEVYLVLKGKGFMHIDDQVKTIVEGDSVLIPAHSVQWIDNIGDEPLHFLALVSPPWTETGDNRLD